MKVKRFEWIEKFVMFLDKCIFFFIYDFNQNFNGIFLKLRKINFRLEEKQERVVRKFLKRKSNKGRFVVLDVNIYQKVIIIIMILNC